jgi:hypothetical protein
MDEAYMPAAPPTAQPWAAATRSVDTETSKGMRMAQAKSIVSGNTLVSKFSNPCQRNRRLSTTPGRAQNTLKKGCSGRRKSSNSWQWQSANTNRHTRVWPSANTICTEGYGQEFKTAARQPAVSRAACTPASSVLQTVASGVVSHQGGWAVGGGSAGGVAHATGAGCSVGVAASAKAGLGTNGSVGMANCSQSEPCRPVARTVTSFIFMIFVTQMYMLYVVIIKIKLNNSLFCYFRIVYF